MTERTEGSDLTWFTKTYHERRGWICDELASVNPLRVWTLNWDPINGYCYLSIGYRFSEVQEGIVEIRTWYIADKDFEQVDDKLSTIDPGSTN